MHKLYQSGSIRKRYQSSFIRRGWNRVGRQPVMNRLLAVVLCGVVILVVLAVLILMQRPIPQTSSPITENPSSNTAPSLSAPHAPRVLGQEDDGVFSDDTLPEVLLVNKDHPLPDGYTAPHTTALAGLLPLMYDSLEVADEVVEPLLALSAASRDAGYGELLVVSAYRTWQEQAALYGEAADKSFVQPPGASEHETGFAVDLAAQDSMMESIEGTDVGQWLMENAYRYGFILRYPADKVDFTGISYEPWHYRYVGVEVATYCYDNNLCLEEYAELAAKY
jgi:D-alanyl-D-alanine carboxypeptidase